MDAVVEGLLIAGLHNLDDDELPVQTNEFYSKTVLGCKPSGMYASPDLPAVSLRLCTMLLQLESMSGCVDHLSLAIRGCSKIANCLCQTCVVLPSSVQSCSE